MLKRDQNDENIANFCILSLTFHDLVAHQEKFDDTLVRRGTPHWLRNTAIDHRFSNFRSQSKK
jgi:hypothetical protein